jgi:hypothetical protein
MDRGGSATVKIVHLIRHGQGYHNIVEDWSIRDAKLTDKGYR